MRALTLIYKPESPRVLGNPDWIRLQFRKEVRIRSGDSFACRSTGPYPSVDRSVDQDQQRAHLQEWLSVVEMYFETSSLEKLTFKSGTGLSDSFEASAFE